MIMTSQRLDFQLSAIFNLKVTPHSIKLDEHGDPELVIKFVFLARIDPSRLAELYTLAQADTELSARLTTDQTAFPAAFMAALPLEIDPPAEGDILCPSCRLNSAWDCPQSKKKNLPLEQERGTNRSCRHYEALD